MTMLKVLYSLIFVAGAGAVTLGPDEQLLSVLQNKLQNWSTGKWQWMPDGKMWALREDPTSNASSWIISITPDFRMTSPTNNVNDVTAPAGGGSWSNYPGADPAINTQARRADINYVTLKNSIPIPPADDTGIRGDGTVYDYNSIWLMNAFRLSETSRPDLPSTHLIGFVHNEEYWGWGGATPEGCTYKSIGVRYSTDLGKSWNRSVPILTKLKQTPTRTGCNVHPIAGTGDMAAMWDHLKGRWVILAQEDQFKPYSSPGLVMSVATSGLAEPYNWTRLEPVSKKTQPGFIGGNDTLAHPDLDSTKGANPSIIWDSQNSLWHMVYAKWGGGLAYTNTSDLTRWQKPTSLPLNYTFHTGSGYPTMIGDQGDTNTTNGRATLYWTDTAKPAPVKGRNLWSVTLHFSPPSGNSVVDSEARGGEMSQQPMVDADW